MQTKQTKRRPGNSTAVKTRQRRQVRRNTADRDVVYIPPKPFNRNRFLLRLATVVAVVLALTLGMSIFFKVENVYVSGTRKYTAWDVKEASGIQEGENLLTLSRARIAGKIRTELPYADDVRVGIKLPDTVNIEIKELDVVYSIEASDGSWWLMSADGMVIDQTNSGMARAYTQLLGVKLQSPQIGFTAVAVEPEPKETEAATEDGEEATEETEKVLLPETVITGKQRLSDAVCVVQQLEENGIIGEVASVDVSNISEIQLWYGQRYQVLLGDSSGMGHKIQMMNAAIDQMGEYQGGVLDVSFTLWPDEVGYTPFT